MKVSILREKLIQGLCKVFLNITHFLTVKQEANTVSRRQVSKLAGCPGTQIRFGGAAPIATALRREAGVGAGCGGGVGMRSLVPGSEFQRLVTSTPCLPDPESRVTQSGVYRLVGSLCSFLIFFEWEKKIF